MKSSDTAYATNYENLKIEHARYKKALRTIQDRYPASADAYVYAVAALNPPILPPPTIAELCAALRQDYSITLFRDGSGGITNTRGTSHSFSTPRDALDLLKGPSPLS